MPLYSQLAQSSEIAITTGVLGAGDRLENEGSLSLQVGPSRPTARRAIQELVNKGLLIRKRGVGTQVVGSRFSRDERLTSLNADLLHLAECPAPSCWSSRSARQCDRGGQLPGSPFAAHSSQSADCVLHTLGRSGTPTSRSSGR